MCLIASQARLISWPEQQPGPCHPGCHISPSVRFVSVRNLYARTGKIMQIAREIFSESAKCNQKPVRVKS